MMRWSTYFPGAIAFGLTGDIGLRNVAELFTTFLKKVARSGTGNPDLLLERIRRRHKAGDRLFCLLSWCLRCPSLSC